MKIKTYGLNIAAFTVLIVTSVGSNANAGEAPVTYTQAEASSFYFTGFGGVNWTDDFDASGSGINLETELDAGYVIGGGLGYRSSMGVRLEVEGAYRSNDVDSVLTNGSRSKGDGDLSSWSIMFNIAKDIEITDRLSLYAGGGVGIAGVDADFRYGAARVNQSDEVFAWQVFAGLSYEVAKNMEFYTEYRYFRAEDPELSRSVRGSTSRLDGDSYANHGILAGVRIHF